MHNLFNILITEKTSNLNILFPVFIPIIIIIITIIIVILLLIISSIIIIWRQGNSLTLLARVFSFRVQRFVMYPSYRRGVC